MSDLPAPAREVIEELVRRAGVDGRRASALRADLERHVLDGIALGRPLATVLERLGDPETVAPLLARSPEPHRPTSPSSGARVWLDSLLGDLRFAVRVLKRTPTFTATATVVLALGIGATTVVFTVLNELLLRPIPVESPETLVDVWSDIPGGNSFLGVAYQDYLTYRADNDVLVDLAAFTGRRMDLGDAGDEREVVAQFVSPGYLEMLGLRPSAGGVSFDPGGDFGAQPVAVLTHALWQDAFASDPDLIGASIVLDGHVVTVIGVGPSGVRGHFIGFPSDLWLPLSAMDPLVPGFDPTDRSMKPLEMIGRRRQGVSVEAVGSALNAIAAGIERQFPELNRGHRVGVTQTTGLDHSLQAGVTAFVLILTAVSGLVLLIACLNVGSVLLVRAMSRDREVAVRIAIGAGRGRLLRQLFTESALLVALGTTVGVVVATWLNGVMAEWLRESGIGIGLDLGVDWTVLGLTAAAAAVAAGAASLAPGFHIVRKDPATALRARDGRAPASARIRSALVVGQVAISVVLVVAAGLLVRSLGAGSVADPGFDADRLATFALTLDADDLGPEGALTLERDLAEALRSLPGVEGVAVADAPPLGVVRTPVPIEIAGMPPPPELDRWVVDGRRVGADYLAQVGIDLLEGRDFTAADAREGPPVAVVSASFVRQFWPEGSAVGRTIMIGAGEVRVVGVARDARYLVQDDTPDPMIYLSRAGEVWSRVLVTLVGPAPLNTSADVHRIVSAVVPGHRRVEPTSVRQVMNDALLPQRVAVVIIGGMGLAALFLAAVGLYGLVQYTVTRDAHELGVRVALGGGTTDLVFAVLRKGFALVGAGTALGVVLALLLSPALGGILVGVGPADPLTYAVVVTTFAAVAVLASWFPVRRALRLDPTVALRNE